MAQLAAHIDVAALHASLLLAPIAIIFDHRFSFCCNTCRRRTTSPSVRFLGHFGAEHGRQMFEQAVNELKLEGLVAKRVGSPCRPGMRSPDWVKVKRQGAVPPERFKLDKP